MPLSRAVAQKVEEFVDAHGEGALDLALASGSLYAEMLPLSQLYWRHALSLFEMNAPTTLVVQLNPAAKRQEPKVDVQAVLGQVELSFPLPSRRSA